MQMLIRTVVALLLLAGCAVAQQETNLNYSKGRSQLKDPIGPYMPRHVPPPNMTNSPRTNELLREGKLYLSLNDAIALALENNLDLGIARYNLAIADTDLLRTKSGAQARGVATGLVSGTPGGGNGGIGASAAGAGAGGTSSGAGGAGSGSGGLVQSTVGGGSTVDSFDPEVNGTLQVEHGTFPQANLSTTGVPSVTQNSGVANFTYFQGFATGTSLQVNFNNNRITSNRTFDTLVPQLNSNFRALVRQHLTSGFGVGPNLRFIHIAKNNREISDIAFKNQVIATVSQIENIYWDLVNAYEDTRVKQRSLDFADKTLADDREQVRIGNMAPVEVTKAEAEVAARNQDLILASTQFELQELLIKNAVTRNMNDPVLADAVVIPTDTMSMPKQEPVVPVQDLVNEAVQHNPDLATARIDMQNRSLSKKAISNALLPQVDLFGFYGGSGLAGIQNTSNANIAPNSIPPTGFSTAFHNLFGSSPDYGAGISVSIPLRNRAAQADQVRSELEYRQAEMRLQQLQNQIAIEVRNAHFAVQQNRARVDAARKARDLAANTLDIEQKKLGLGASSSSLVLTAQRDLGVAESNLAAAETQYEKSRVELDRVTGQTLLHLGIDITDAESGRVQRMPNVPGVLPRNEVQGAPATPK
jgi:outer membrane protein